MGALLIVASLASAAQSTVTAQVQPGQIALGESAQLTIIASGGTSASIAPPVVPGLDFAAVSQSSQMESVNGRTSTTSTVVYQVTPQRVGIYTIPAPAKGSQPMVLQVRAGNAGSQAAGASASALPALAAGALAAGATQMAADGAAFVRLRVPKGPVYVGESVPVDIQVGMREGLVAALQGLPTLNGDAFTLNKLSTQPQQGEEIINGKPFTVLTWRSVLVAIKPGSLSLKIETPLTVRMRTASGPADNPFGDAAFADLFNDPMFQNFSGGTTEQDITVASAPLAFDVLALPAQNRPPGFSGAVGQFSIRSDLSAPSTSAGDPITLRLHVTGTGTFDRVTSPMLAAAEPWKTYQPTATFTPLDNAGYRGDKLFEQPIIATSAGHQQVPALSFSYFDPLARRYETVQTSPLSITVLPAQAGSASAGAADTRVAAATNDTASTGLRPDHTETGSPASSLVPFYFHPRFLVIPSVLILAIGCGWLELRRRELLATSGNDEREVAELTAATLAQMDAAAAAGDGARFLGAARSVLQRTLAKRWQLRAGSITPQAIDALLGENGQDIEQLLALADQANYAGSSLDDIDFPKWRQVVLRHINGSTAA